MMTLDSLDALRARKAAIAIHHERDMFRHSALPQRANQHLAQLPERPLDGRELREPLARRGKVH